MEENMPDNKDTNEEEKLQNNTQVNQNETKKGIKNTMWTIVLVITTIALLLVIGFCIFLFITTTQVKVAKPIIYLYPIEDTQVVVELKNKELITTSYPKYESKWNVLAKKDGKLVDLDTNKNLYSLYYEQYNKVNFKIEDEGFIVKGENSAEFLEEKLKILGLNDYEAEEFIIYWLPKLEKNNYNYIRFATINEINENMPLKITPKPDSLIRVLMIFKGLNKPINIKEQKLDNVERNGFVAVEWGGAEIK